GTRVVGRHTTGTFSERPIPAWEPLTVHQVEPNSIIEVGSFTPDGKKLLLYSRPVNATPAARLLLWDFILNKVTTTVMLPEGRPAYACLSPNRRLVAAYYRTAPPKDSTEAFKTSAIVYDVGTSKEIKRWTVSHARFTGMPSGTFLPDSTKL